ncbi:restriction endonuclease subunit R, partial [Salmonella enterica subsp. enterica serovar Saphra]|nr:restriction endonuclease subunit R [Salmonella enterica subsp. enterica serovar Saphra]
LYVRYANGNVDNCPKFTLPPLTPSSASSDKKHLEEAIQAQIESRDRELALQRALQQEQEKAELLTQRLDEARARNQHVADILSIDEAE